MSDDFEFTDDDLREMVDIGLRDMFDKARAAALERPLDELLIVNLFPITDEETGETICTPRGITVKIEVSHLPAFGAYIPMPSLPPHSTRRIMHPLRNRLDHEGQSQRDLA